MSNYKKKNIDYMIKCEVVFHYIKLIVKKARAISI